MNNLPGYIMNKKASTLGWVLVLAFLGATGFVVFRFAPSQTRAVMAPRPATTLSWPEDTEDLRRHEDDAFTALKEASSSIARSRDWTDRALTSLDDPALTARRLQLARSASRSAEAQIDRAYAQIELINGILTERTQK